MKILIFIGIVSAFAFAHDDNDLEKLQINRIPNILSSRDLSIDDQLKTSQKSTCADKFGIEYEEGEPGYSNCRLDTQNKEGHSASFEFEI